MERKIKRPTSLLADLMAQGDRVWLHNSIKLRFANVPVEKVECEEQCCCCCFAKRVLKIEKGTPCHMKLTFEGFATTKVKITRNTPNSLELKGFSSPTTFEHSEGVNGVEDMWLLPQPRKEIRLYWNIILRRSEVQHKLCRGYFLWVAHPTSSWPLSIPPSGILKLQL